MNQSKHRRGRPTATQFGLTSEQGLDEGTDVTVVFAVVTRTFNEDKLMISQRKIMYHMARSPPAMHANL
jgi:hypothetical protein